MKKLILAVIAGVAIVLLINHFFAGDTQQSNMGQGRRGAGKLAAVAVEVETIKLDRLVDKGIFTGTLLANTEFNLIPKISGRIRKLHVNTGDRVSSGEVIAELDNEELLLAVKQAEAELEIARANYNESAGLLEISKKELERAKTMRQQKVASDVELEKAQAAYKTSQAKHQISKAQLSHKQASLDAARVRLSYARVDVNWSNGSAKRFIARKFLDEGAMATTNSPIVSVIDIATLTAVIDVVEKEYFKIKVGQHAQIYTDAIEGCIYPARVIRMAPLLESSSRLARVELELSNTDFLLKPGMFVTAEIIFETHESATLVPNSSVVRREESKGIFVVDETGTRARFIQIEPGFADEEFTEIKSPVISGKVVTLGHHLLEDGSPISIPDLSQGTSNKEKAGDKK